MTALTDDELKAYCATMSHEPLIVGSYSSKQIQMDDPENTDTLTTSTALSDFTIGSLQVVQREDFQEDAGEAQFSFVSTVSF